MIVDGGKFDWNKGAFPQINQPSRAYHGMNFSEVFGPIAFIIRARVEGLRDIGSVPQPVQFVPVPARHRDAGHAHGPPRLQHHGRGEIPRPATRTSSWVNYPGLPGSPYHDLAKKYLPKGAGRCSASASRAATKPAASWSTTSSCFSHLANVGDARSLVIHPASTTHQQLSAAEQKAAGVEPDMIRLSIGLEDIDDILWDLDQALAASQK